MFLSPQNFTFTIDEALMVVLTKRGELLRQNAEAARDEPERTGSYVRIRPERLTKLCEAYRRAPRDSLNIYLLVAAKAGGLKNRRD